MRTGPRETKARKVCAVCKALRATRAIRATLEALAHEATGLKLVPGLLVNTPLTIVTAIPERLYGSAIETHHTGVRLRSEPLRREA